MSGLRCWPGCLAEVVDDREFPQNNGVRGVVVGRATEDEFGELWGEEWSFKPASPLWAWDDDERTQASPGMPGHCTAMYDRALRPVVPPPAADSSPTTADKPQPVEV